MLRHSSLRKAFVSLKSFLPMHDVRVHLHDKLREDDREHHQHFPARYLIHVQW